MVLRRPGGGTGRQSRPGLWRDGISRNYINENKYSRRKRREGIKNDKNVVNSFLSDLIDVQYNLSSKSMFYGITAFMLIIFGYIILEKMINLNTDSIILGCTELPIVIDKSEYCNNEIIDPVDLLAEEMNKF